MNLDILHFLASDDEVVKAQLEAMQLLPPAKRRFHYNPNSLSDLNVNTKAQEEFWGFVDVAGAPHESEQAQRDERPCAKMSASAG
jgi:hypothetical protein